MITYRGYRLNDKTGTTAYSRIDIYDTNGQYICSESTLDDAKSAIDFWVEGGVR